jgi:exonuclease SbcC
MRFKKIKIKNIRSYQDQEIEFPQGSLLLSGNVGSGKTSILLAIEYALFGLQPGQKGTSLLRNTKEAGEVSLELEISGQPVIINRRLKRTTKGVSNEYAAIIVNGEITESSVTEIKSKIVELLGYPPEFVKKNNVLYRYTVHTPQEQMKQIILEDAETRLNILRHVFGVDKYKQIKNNLSVLLIKLKGDSKILQGEIKTLDADKANLEQRKLNLENVKERIKKLEFQLAEKTKKRKEIELELKEVEAEINKKKEFESEIEKTKIMVLTKNEILASISKEQLELKQLLSETKERFNEEIYAALISQIKQEKEKKETLDIRFLELASKISSFEKEQNDILAKKERIFKIDICPTCLQDVPEAHKHNILNETENKLSKIKRDLENLEKDKKEVAVSIEKQKQNILHLEESKTNLEILKSKQEQTEKSLNKLKDLEKQSQTIINDRALLEKHIESLREKVLFYSSFEAKFRNKDSELKQALLEERNTEISLAECKKELELSHKEISLLQEIIRKKEEAKVKLHEII